MDLVEGSLAPVHVVALGPVPITLTLPCTTLTPARTSLPPSPQVDLVEGSLAGRSGSGIVLGLRERGVPAAPTQVGRQGR